VLDSKLTVGAELLVEYETGNSDSDEGEPGLTPAGMGHGTTVMIGPTVLYKPTRNTYLGLVPLFGLTHDAPVAEAFLSFGIDLEPLLWGKSGTGKSDKDFDQFPAPTPLCLCAPPAKCAKTNSVPTLESSFAIS